MGQRPSLSAKVVVAGPATQDRCNLLRGPSRHPTMTQERNVRRRLLGDCDLYGKYQGVFLTAHQTLLLLLILKKASHFWEMDAGIQSAFPLKGHEHWENMLPLDIFQVFLHLLLLQVSIWQMDAEAQGSRPHGSR